MLVRLILLMVFLEDFFVAGVIIVGIGRKNKMNAEEYNRLELGLRDLAIMIDERVPDRLAELQLRLKINSILLEARIEVRS